MRTVFRILVTLAFFITVSAAFLGGTVPAGATIYDADMMGRIKMSAAQRPKVLRILKRSGRDLQRTLRKNGINPNDPHPKALKLFKASGQLSAIGRRTRSQLSKVLNAQQLKQYDKITKEVEGRIRRAVRL
ncbi:MAG: hypothetical protein ACR2PM_05580 [Hyphomicrobiales bacterium]